MGGWKATRGGLVAALAARARLSTPRSSPPDAAAAAVGCRSLRAGAPSTSGRPRAFLRGRRQLARALAGIDVVHYPLTVPAPLTPAAVRRHPARRAAPRPSASSSRRVFARFAAAPTTPARGAADPRDRAQLRPSATGRSSTSGSIRGRVRVIHHGARPRALPAGRRARASRSCSIRRGPGRTRTTRCSSRLRAAPRRAAGLELVLTGGGHEPLRLPPGARSLGRVPSAELARLYRRPPRSCSRAATRASAGRCSRRWRAAARSRRERHPAPRRVGGGDRRRGRLVLFEPTSADGRRRRRSRRGARRGASARSGRGARDRRGPRAFTWERAAGLHDAVLPRARRRRPDPCH